jgi:hypothetical protein
MTKKIVRPLNALKSGAYARGDTILPWESAAEFETLRAEIFDDLQPQRKLERDTASNIVENRWQRERLRRTTAIATHRHAFGRKLEESGAESWPDALEVVRRRDVERHDALQRIAQSACKTAEAATNWTSEVSDAVEELAREVVTACEATVQDLAQLEVALDEEREFFREYSPKQLDRRVRLENSLDAQLDKLLGRFVALQEARILRDKLRQPEKTAGLAQSHNDVAEASKSSSKAPPPYGEGGEKLDLAELDRDDIEEVSEVAKERPSGHGKGPVDSAKLDRDDDDIDPFAEFVAEVPCAEPDQDDDGTDDWGQPKQSTG